MIPFPFGFYKKRTYQVVDCYDFDGNDDYITYNENTLSGGNTDPWSLVLYSENLDTDQQQLLIQDSQQGLYVSINNVSGNWVIQVIAYDNTSSASNRLVARSGNVGSVGSNVKRHIGITFDGTDANGFKFYHDGSLVSTTVIENDATWSGVEWGNIRIGRGLTTLYTDGKMADWRIYDRELSGSEVNDIFTNGTVLGNEHQWFKMDSVDGTTVKSSAGVDGTDQSTGGITVTTW